MSDREEKTGKNDNGKKNKGGKRNKIVAIEMIILVLLIMSAVAIFIQRDKSVKEAAKIHNQKAKKTEQTPQAAQKENEIEEETEGTEEETGDRDASVPDRSNFAVQPGVSVGTTEQSDEKIVYLTLDDGPSDNTQAVLDILDKYNAKATFFVTGEMPEYKDMIKAAYDKGHTIGMHIHMIMLRFMHRLMRIFRIWIRLGRWYRKRLAMYHVLSVSRVDHQILYQRNIQQESCPRLCRKYKTVDISIMTGTEVPAMGL